MQEKEFYNLCNKHGIYLNAAANFSVKCQMAQLENLIEDVKKCAQTDKTSQAVVGGQKVADLVDKFLAWELPKTVCSDLCVTDKNYPHKRSGTNLLTADEAKQMLEYLLGNFTV